MKHSERMKKLKESNDPVAYRRYIKELHEQLNAWGHDRFCATQQQENDEDTKCDCNLEDYFK